MGIRRTMANEQEKPPVMTAQQVDKLLAEVRRKTTLQVFSDIRDRASIASRAGIGFGGDRDIWEALGYREDLEYEDYRALYDRQDIAGKVVDLPAQDTWRKGVVLRDGLEDGGEEKTGFTDAFRSLDKELSIVRTLGQLDKITGIGRYGILLFGVEGEQGKELSQPLEGTATVIFLRAFDEGMADFSELVIDPSSLLFGMPKSYNIEFGEGIGTRNVHHTRVLHVVENAIDDRVFGTPRLQRVFNRLFDMLKVVGGSAEALWKVMDRGLHADLRDGVELDDTDKDEMSDELDEYMHGLRRFIRTQGIDLKSLGSDQVDPTGVFNVLIALVSAASNIPQRILLGSERGELASSQDEVNWNKRITDRQTNFAEPDILRPVVDRLIALGSLEQPTNDDYNVVWGSPFELSELDKAKLAQMIADAVSKISPISPELVVETNEFREKYLDLPPIEFGEEFDEEDEQEETTGTPEDDFDEEIEDNQP